MSEASWAKWNLVVPGQKVVGAERTPLRFNFFFNGHLVPSLFYRNSCFPDRLLVLFNGAVDRSNGKDPREVFQRRTWCDEIEANVLILADATLQPSNEIAIGWAQGNGTPGLVGAMAQCVSQVQDSIGVSNSRTLFYGSSAGGHQALRLHAVFQGSRFLVDNAQFDWTLYYANSVNKVLNHSFAGLAVQELRDDPAIVTDALRPFLENALPIQGKYMVNIASKADFKVQLPVVEHFLKERALKSDKVNTKFGIYFYHCPSSGHSPQDKQTTLNEINNYLSREF